MPNDDIAFKSDRKVWKSIEPYNYFVALCLKVAVNLNLKICGYKIRGGSFLSYEQGDKKMPYSNGKYFPFDV